MARNRYLANCYECGRPVAPGTGHFERHNGGWRTKHAIVPGHGRITCELVEKQTKPCPKEASNADHG
jgi:hypothetical protein